MANKVYGNPLLIRDNEGPLALDRIPISDKGYDEKFVQQLAFNHPSCLPVSEIDGAYEELVPVCMELGTPAGPMDALYVTPKGRLVILEAKLWRNPEARRKVVAQILDYAKELSGWNYEDLQREVSKNLKQKGNVLYELVAKQYPATDEAKFVDDVQQSLEQGRFLLLILGDGIREGAAAIAEFLESVGNLEFTFGLVELALYKGSDTGMFVQPRVVAHSTIINRHVVQLMPGLRLADDSTPEEMSNSIGLSENGAANYEFWKQFLSNLTLDDPGQPHPGPTGHSNLYFALPTSSRISAFIGRYKQHAGVFITWPKGSFADAVYETLLKARDEIDSELGLAVQWESKGGTHKIVVRRNFTDVAAESERQDVHDFLADAVNRFVNAFRGRMKRVAEELEQ